MPDERTYPHEDNPGGTHWPDCYRAPGHHNCAVKRADELQDALTAADVRFRKFERAVRHLLFRNHDHDPACEGCVEFAAFLALPGYQGAPHPLVDGH